MSSLPMYDILGKFKNLDPNMTPVKEDVKTEPVYESVEARGDIMEAVKSLEEKYMGFKKVAAAAKAGGAEDPAAVAASIGRKKYGKKKFQKAAAAGKKLGEGHDDLTDLDDYQFAEPDTDADVKPAKSKAEQAAIRRRIQDLADKAREKDDWFDGEEKVSNVRTHHAKFQDEPETDLEEALTDEQKLERYHELIKQGMDPDDAEVQVFNDEGDEDDLDEVAPPGAKAERMVKHIKKGYAKDGKLTKREKGIAYATAWKAHNKGQVEEGCEFGDTIANSKAELKKAKPAKLKESRVMEETDYFYEKIGKSLAQKNPTLNTASPEFTAAVRKEMVAQGMDVNRARNIMSIDSDFISDVATSYAHNCQEIAECGAPINSHLGGGMEELDEIARLAGLPEGNAFTGKLATTQKGEKFTLGDKEFTDTSDLGETAVEEEMEMEGNEFSGALAKAKASGAKEFEVDGKRYTVKEDITLTADGDDVANLLRKLAGLDPIAPTEPAPAVGVAVPMEPQAAVEPAADIAAEPVDAQPAVDAGQEIVAAEPEVAVDLEEEGRDIEYLNTPREKNAPIGAAIPSGTDLNRSKEQDPRTANKAANPLAVKEENLWGQYTGLLKELIKK